MPFRPGVSKYRARPQMVDGIKFPSGLQARRYRDLKLRETAGEIWGLVAKPPRYPLVVNGSTVGHYTPDFEYIQCDCRGEPEHITEETKGFVVRDFPMRKKLFEALYNRRITVVTKDQVRR